MTNPVERRMTWYREAWYSARRQWTRVKCLLLGHREDLSNSGYGFGKMDLFCARCDLLLRSIPLSEMTDEMRDQVARMGGASLLMKDSHDE